jgi:hypothetical protein
MLFLGMHHRLCIHECICVERSTLLDLCTRFKRIMSRIFACVCVLIESSLPSPLHLDIVGFTQLSSTLTPQELVNLLSHLYTEIDQITDHLGVMKVRRGVCACFCLSVHMSLLSLPVCMLVSLLLNLLSPFSLSHTHRLKR